jgi:sialidase-1
MVRLFALFLIIEAIFFNICASGQSGPLIVNGSTNTAIDESTQTKKQSASILETKIICREPGKYLGDGSVYSIDKDGHLRIEKRVVEQDRYLGWPTITRTQKGELIVAFSGDRDAHVCPWGKTQIIRSPDNGESWSEPETITDTPLDDRDAGLIQTNEGTLVVSWFTSLAFDSNDAYWKPTRERYARHSESIGPEIREKWSGNWVRRSEDNGKTWQEPIKIDCSAPHGPIQLHDGRLLFVGTGMSNGFPGTIVVQSADDGKTWNYLATIPKQDPKMVFNEPHVVELSGGKLLAMVRYEPGFMHQSESMDGGKTWSLFHSTGILGFPPHLIKLKNKVVLVVYGFRREPYGERACISRDEGKTWDTENQITLSLAPTRDLGYPSSVQLGDDSILTVFYQSEEPGKPTVIMSTHWKIDP